MKADTSIASDSVAATQKAPLALDQALHSTSAETLLVAAADPALTEDLALALLKRPEIPVEVLEQLAKNSTVMKLRKAKLALVAHPKTPRHVSVPLVRHVYLFDLMQLALTPTVPADIKIAAEEALVTRLETVSVGEKLTLARRASSRVAGALLLDKEPRIMQAALENGRLTESSIVKTVLRPDATAALVEAVCRNPKWSVRQEVRLALLRNEKTPLSYAICFARSLPRTQLLQVLQNSRLPARVKAALEAEFHAR